MSLSKLTAKDRFVDVTDDILAQKYLQVQKENTKNDDKAAECQFREYLTPKDCDHTRFWGYDKETLVNSALQQGKINWMKLQTNQRNIMYRLW